jgi:hypothetical protein
MMEIVNGTGKVAEWVAQQVHSRPSYSTVTLFAKLRGWSTTVNTLLSTPHLATA